MGKVKQKNHDEVRFLQGEVRRLQKVIRSLEQEVRALKKYEHQYEISQDEEIEASEEDTHVVLKKLLPCTSDSCGKGFYKEMELAGKLFGTCNICGYSKRLK